MLALPHPAAAGASGGHVAFGAETASTTWFFAEGYTGSGFQEYLTISNAGTERADVSVTYLGLGQQTIEVAPRSRATVDVNAAAGPGHEVAIEVSASVPVVVERPVYFESSGFGYGPVDGGHVALGATAPGTSFHFAEGYTGAGFQTYVTIGNPQATAALIRLSLVFAGRSPKELDVTVPPRSRTTVDVNREAGAETEVGIVATSDLAVVVERPVYFRRAVGAAGPVDGGHDVVGAASASTAWFFAEGYTGPGFQEYLSVMNPGTVPANLDATFHLPDGSSRTTRIGVPPRSRATLDVNSVLGPGAESSVTLSSDRPVVAERSVYFSVGRFEGGHNALGITAPSTTWEFAEGFTRGDFRTYLTVLNPGKGPVDVPLAFLLRDGQVVETSLAVGAMSRATLDLAAAVGPDQEVSTRVGPAGSPVVAERPMYFHFALASSPTAIVAAAGDIACDPADPGWNGGLGTEARCHMRATSDLLVASARDAVLALGDLQYEDGAAEKFAQSYDPTWGKVKAVTRPVAGNHDYGTEGAEPYYSYFGNAAGDPAKGYYSFDLGSWHVVALNSNCYAVGGCGPGSTQEQWLVSDLATSTAPCTLAYWHHARWSSGKNGSDSTYDAFWRALYADRAEIVLNGHDHDYERFAPQDPDQSPTPSGIRAFVVGTGGRDLRPFETIEAHSEVRAADTFGVLELTLRHSGYDWRFVAEPGGAFTDSGSGFCA